MPPRQRRSGYKPIQLSAQMQDAIAAEAQRLANIESDFDLIDATTEWFNALDDAIDTIADPRLHAVARLRRANWSYDRLAAATPLSKSRLVALARRAEELGY